MKPGGRIAYFTIFIAPDVSAAGRRRAREAGPPAVYTRAEQADLLRTAGFADVEERDVTKEFLTAAKKLLAANRRHANALRPQLGAVAFDERQEERARQIEAIEDGLLQRALFVGTRPRRSAGA